MKNIRLPLSLAVAFLICSLSPAFAAKGDVIDVTKLRDSIRIFLGQKIVIGFDQQGDRLTNPRRIQGAQKRPALTLEFYADKKSKTLLMLLVESSYPRIVRYRAAARGKGRPAYYETIMLPINPNIPVLEGWSDPLDCLLLYDFHLTNEKPPKTA